MFVILCDGGGFNLIREEKWKPHDRNGDVKNSRGPEKPSSNDTRADVAYQCHSSKVGPSPGIKDPIPAEF